MEFNTTDNSATVTVNGDQVMISFKFTDHEQAFAFAENLVRAHRAGEEISFTLSCPEQRMDS